ncbi:MAG TPA: hypothetical protein VKI43_01960, partial [Vicinamibacterales bacterium]|nr:hypothetical protein [Vicinamibacterales bacterium]
MDELKADWDAARRLHPRLVLGVATAFLLIATVAGVSGVWFLLGLRTGLPDLATIQRIGEMDQSTAVFDDTDHLA